MSKLYKVIMIVLPLFVGSGGIVELICYFSNNGSTMNPIISALLAIVGMATGIRNILKLIDKD